jgi:hypothetical protein
MASRKEEKERRRAERLEQEAARRQRERRLRRIYSVVAGGVLLVAAAVAIIVAVSAGGGSHPADYSIQPKNTLDPPARKIANLDQAAKAAGCELKNPPIAGRTHLFPNQPTPKYGTDPPTSGNHDPVPTPDGVYLKEPPPRNFLHTLEHGRIEIQYTPTLSKKRVRQLGGIFNESPALMLLFPNKTMPYEVAVTAWGHLAGCKKVTNETFDVVKDFRDRYRDKGPEPSTSQQANF